MTFVLVALRPAYRGQIQRHALAVLQVDIGGFFGTVDDDAGNQS